jgi:hypothetical protein
MAIVTTVITVAHFAAAIAPFFMAAQGSCDFVFGFSLLLQYLMEYFKFSAMKCKLTVILISFQIAYQPTCNGLNLSCRCYGFLFTLGMISKTLIYH